jgi:hypothetical protein
MALLIRIRTREATDPALMQSMRLVSATASQPQERREPDAPLDEQQAERAAQNLTQDYARARQVILRSAAQEAQLLKTAAKTSIGAATATVPRVFQLDGERVETEIHKMLVGQVTGAFEMLDAGWPYQWSEEIKLAMSVVFYRFGVWGTSQSFGDKLMNLVYRDERVAAALGRGHVPMAAASTVPSRTLKACHALLTVLLPYLFRKLERHVLEHTWATTPADAAAAARHADADDGIMDGAPRSTLAHIFDKLPAQYRAATARAVETVAAATAVLEVLHFCLFLLTGQYRSLADRLLGMRLVHGRQRMARNVSLYYMNQSIFWQVVLGFASVVLPLLRLGRVWNLITSFRAPWAGSGHALGGDARRGSVDHCAFCGTAASAIVMPRTLRPCQHVACYVCYASRHKAAGGVSASDDNTMVMCPVCDSAVEDVELLRIGRHVHDQR